MSSIMQDFLINLFAGVIGILIVLWLESKKKPSLTMVVGDANTIEENDPLHRTPTTFLRVEIHNRNVPKILSPVYIGEHAFSCMGWISFYHLDGQAVFSNEMLARWSATQDPPTIEHVVINGENVRRLVNPQNTIDIPPGDFSHLDVCVRFSDDSNCYGWNNNSYMYPDWKQPDWKLGSGRYLTRIRVRTSGIDFQEVFILVNDVSIKDFRLEPAPKVYRNLILNKNRHK